MAENWVWPCLGPHLCFQDHRDPHQPLLPLRTSGFGSNKRCPPPCRAAPVPHRTRLAGLAAGGCVGGFGAGWVAGMRCGTEEPGFWLVRGWMPAGWQTLPPSWSCTLPGNQHRWEPTTPPGQWGSFGVVPKRLPSPHSHARELEPAAGPCSCRPVWVLQSQRAISQVSPSPGTPWGRQGGAGASLKARLGRVLWVQGEKRAGVIGSHRPCCPNRRQTDRHSGTPGRSQVSSDAGTEKPALGPSG